MLVQSTLIISTSLISNNRLSQSENLVPVLTWKSNNRYQNIVEKRRNCSSGAISPLFYNISNISLNFRSQITYSFVKCGCSIYCFPQFCKSDMSRYAYRKLFQSPMDFEIMRVDCIYTMQKQGCHTALEKIKNDNLR